MITEIVLFMLPILVSICVFMIQYNVLDRAIQSSHVSDSKKIIASLTRQWRIHVFLWLYVPIRFIVFIGIQILYAVFRIWMFKLDHTILGMTYISEILSILIGIIVTFIMAFLIGRALARKKEQQMTVSYS